MSATFEFLAPDQAAAEGGHQPLLRSPMEHLQEQAGASFEVRDGWNVATAYSSVDDELRACRETVGFGDSSYFGKLEVQASAQDMPGVIGAACGGAALELGKATRAGDGWLCPVTPERTIVVTPPSRTAAVREALEAAPASGLVSVIEVTTGFAALTVAGPQARETFARLTALDLRPERLGEQGFLPGSVARVPAMTIRTGGDRFLLLFSAAQGQYVWTVVADAAENLGGRPAGADALAQLATATPEAPVA